MLTNTELYRADDESKEESTKYNTLFFFEKQESLSIEIKSETLNCNQLRYCTSMMAISHRTILSV